jgi:NAD(P)-dependent dehydrogenase (short-subunit alcohol dehydrogenase family)
MSLATITGYGARKATPYNPSTRFPPGSLSGKVFIVTGGHAGIGYSTTKFLVQGGARVIIASRTESKVREAIDSLAKEHPQDSNLRQRLDFVKLDLNSLHQVEQSAEEILSKEQRVDGIVTNAGSSDPSYQERSLELVSDL